MMVVYDPYEYWRLINVILVSALSFLAGYVLGLGSERRK